MEEKKDNTKLLNLFFYFEKIPDFYDELKEIIQSAKDKVVVKGEFTNLDILNEISYYLGIKDKTRGQIKNKESQNVIISYISLNSSKILLKAFVEKFKKGIIKNDDHPYFIFFFFENNANFNIKNIFDDVHKFQENFNDTRKLDSRNIFLENKETIIYRIEELYNFYNEKEEMSIDIIGSSNYDKYNTINIFTVGKRGSGKSTLINRLLGEKKAYAQKNARTDKTKEYYHKCYPIKLIDSAGFEIGKNNELINAEDFLKKNNLNFENINKKIHFIFYLFKNNDKLEDKEIEIIKKFYSFNIDIFFIITFMKEDDEESSKADFEDILKKSFSNDEIEKIIDNTFGLDLLNVQYSNIICDIFNRINEKLKKYKQSNDNIIEYLNNYNCVVKTEDFNYEFIEEENKPTILEEGIITPNIPNNPNDVIDLIKAEIKNNIFFIDFKNDRENRRNMAKNIVKSFKTPGFWFSSIPIPILNEHLSRKSKEKMIAEISSIYDFVIKKKLKDVNFKENNKNVFVNFIFKIGGFVAGMWNVERVEKLGEKIIDELDAIYAKINVLNVYYDIAQKLNKNFEIMKDFPEKFNNSEFWYNANIK